MPPQLKKKWIVNSIDYLVMRTDRKIKAHCQPSKGGRPDTPKAAASASAVAARASRVSSSRRAFRRTCGAEHRSASSYSTLHEQV